MDTQRVSNNDVAHSVNRGDVGCYNERDRMGNPNVYGQSLDMGVSNSQTPSEYGRITVLQKGGELSILQTRDSSNAETQETGVISPDILLLYAEICARENNIPLTVFNKLSRLNHSFCTAVQSVISAAMLIRLKWIPQLGTAYQKKLINHPFTYEFREIKTSPVMSLSANMTGIVFLDDGAPIDIDNRIMSFSDVAFHMRSRVRFAMCLGIISDSGYNPIYLQFITESDYIDTRPGDPDVDSQYTRLRNWMDAGGDFPFNDDTGRYLLKLNLPTRINQITLGTTDFVNPLQLSIAVAPEHLINKLDDNSYEFAHDMDFSVAYISHITVYFDVTEKYYDRSAYCVRYNGDLNMIKKKSLVCLRSKIQTLNTHMPQQNVEYSENEEYKEYSDEEYKEYSENNETDNLYVLPDDEFTQLDKK